MGDERARERVAAERVRVEAALGELTSDVKAEGAQEGREAGDASELGEVLQTQGVQMALIEELRDRLEAVEAAEDRLAAGTYGRSVESGAEIPEDRLEAEPLAERTFEEQAAFERRGGSS